jgi:hypothetical protein
MERTSMPEATVYEHRHLGPREYHIGGPTDARDWARRYAVPQTTPVQDGPQQQLWSGIPAAVSLHDLPYGRGGGAPSACHAPHLTRRCQAITAELIRCPRTGPLRDRPRWPSYRSAALALVRCGADDGNRTRVFSLGSYFQARTGERKSLVNGVISKPKLHRYLRIWSGWRTAPVRAGNGCGSVV